MQMFTRICLLGLYLAAIGAVSSFAQSHLDPGRSAQRAPIEISLLVTDSDGKFVSGITKDQLSLSVGGKSYAIESLEEKTHPVAYVLAIDNSGSMRTIFNDLMTSARSIVDVNQGRDMTLLMRFVGKNQIAVSKKFTNDRKYIDSQFGLFGIEGGQTALIDAIYSSVSIVENQTGIQDDLRRAVIVISDGEERASERKEADLKNLIASSNVPIFFVGLTFQLSKEAGFTDLGPKNKALELIKRITKESGGSAIFPDSVKDLPAAAKQIAATMRKSYVLRIQPNDSLRPAALVDVRLTNGPKQKDWDFSFRPTLPKF